MRLAVLVLALPCAALLALAAPANADMLRKSQTGAITVSDAGGTPPVAGSPYPSTVNVAGATGHVSDVAVKLNDVEHAFPDDMDVLLVGPAGQRAIVMSDAGAGEAISGVDLTFDDGAGASLPDGGPLVSGTYRPTNHDAQDFFPAGAPSPPYSAGLGDAFDGTQPNGDWKLYVVDDGSGDAGKIAGGWTLTLTLGHRVTNNDPITIGDSSPPTPASPYPSELIVTDALGTVKEVSVRLHGFQHEDPGDVDIMLSGPGGTRTTLMSDAGGTTDVSGRSLRFDDDAAGTLTDVAPLESGSYKPANLQGPDAFPGDAPPQDETASLGVFEGIHANGQWRLWVVDDSGNAGGSIVNGWSLNVTLRSGVRLAASSVEANEGAGVHNLVVERPEGGGAATVHYELPGAAHAKDVKPASGNLAFALGQKTKNLPVTVYDDSGDEPLEYPQVVLDAVAGDVSTPSGGEYTSMLIDDDDATDARDDFNGDGRADQAIGVPKENLNAGTDAGAVQILYGADGGLSAAADQRFTQDTAGMPDVAEPGDQFGAAVAASDFDGDGYGDLAIGAPGEDDGGITDMGRVTVLYGSPSGLTTAGAQLLGQGSPGVPDDNEAGDRFGAALAAGNLGRGARGDLAIGQPGEDIGVVKGAGAVTTLYGVSTGLGTAGAALWHQDTPAVEQTAEAADAFGSVLSIGDFGWGAEGDLAIGVPAENAGRGVVQVLYGTTATGIAAAGDDLFSQSTPGMGAGSIAEDGDGFGSSLAVGEIRGQDAAVELAVGSPGENLGGVADAGLAHVLRGADANGLTTGDSSQHQQSDADIATGNGAGDRFGAAVAIGQFGGDGATPSRAVAGDPFTSSEGDLAVGVPGEAFGGLDNAGAVQVIYGKVDSGHSEGPPNAQWHQDKAGVADTNEAGDQFGAALANGLYRGGEEEGLSIGVPGEKLGTAAGAGGFAVLFSTAYSGIGAEGSQRWQQGAGSVQDAAEAADGFGGVLAP